MKKLERAISLAVHAHNGQLDKIQEPYILHPMRVMLAVNTEKERIVAILHDVVEDTTWSIEDLLATGFDKEIVEAVALLSKEKGQDYSDYLRKIKCNQLALTVKKADITDNLSPRRLYNMAPDKAEYLKNKYENALRIINSTD